MYKMALVAGMGSFDFLFLQMFGHGHRLDNLAGPGLYRLIMTPQAQDFDFFPLFDRKFSKDFARFDVIGIRAVAEFA